MTRRLIPWTTAGLLVLACSSGETPNDNNGNAGTGTTPSAGTQGTAGSSSGSAGKATAGAGGSAGTAAATGGTAGTTMPGAGQSGAGAAGSPGGAGPSGGAGGATPTAGATGNAGAPGAGAGAGGAGSAGMAGGPAGGAGAGGAPAGGMGGMASSTKSYTCNQVVGIDSTSEWFTGGFENQVPNEKWQIIYFHPGYVENWADPNDEVWTLAPTSACTANSTNPDRVIFNIYSETLTATGTLVTALNLAITNFKNKYSRLQRIDVLTMTRAPNNMPCQQGNNGSIVQQYVDDAALMVVSAGPPPIIASPKFFAADCNVFDAGGPHFSTAGKPVVAKIYGDYYLAEP